MAWQLPGAVTGALAGFCLGFLALFSLVSLGVDVSGWPTIGLGILGAVGGAAVGAHLQGPPSRARTVARWCAALTLVVGGVGFLAGFVGPILLRPDLPQGPLLGIFFTGPLGALAGAVAGAVVGLLVPSAAAHR